MGGKEGGTALTEYRPSPGTLLSALGVYVVFYAANNPRR